MKIIVIGAGLLGLSSAKVLLERGHEVVVLEANDGVALETSFANAGDLGAVGSGPWNTPLFGKNISKQDTSEVAQNNSAASKMSVFDPLSPVRVQPKTIPSMMVWGLKFLRNCTQARFDLALQANYQLGVYSHHKTKALRERWGLDYDSGSDGTMKLFRDEAARASAMSLLKSMANQGLKYTQLTAAEAIAVEPQLAGIDGKFVGAVHFNDDERGDAYLFCAELARVIQTEGGEIRTNVRVSHLVKKGRSVVGVDTDQGFMAADGVIVAAGNASRALLKTVGLSLPITPVKGHSLTLDMKGQPMPNVPVVDAANFGMVTPLGQRLRVAGLVDFAGFDKGVQTAAIDNLYKLLAALYPSIAAQVDRCSTQTWAGLRPLSADGRPFIGQSKVAGLFLNTGHGQTGWASAMGSAHLLADLLDARPTEIDPKPFLATR